MHIHETSSLASSLSQYPFASPNRCFDESLARWLTDRRDDGQSDGGCSALPRLLHQTKLASISPSLLLLCSFCFVPPEVIVIAFQIPFVYTVLTPCVNIEEVPRSEYESDSTQFRSMQDIFEGLHGVFNNICLKPSAIRTLMAKAFAERT